MVLAPTIIDSFFESLYVRSVLYMPITDTISQNMTAYTTAARNSARVCAMFPIG